MGLVKEYNLQRILEVELERMKWKLRMGYELRVVWLPDNNSNLSGEVKGEPFTFMRKSLKKP